MADASEREAKRTKHAAVVCDAPAPPMTTITWTLQDLTLKSFTDADSDDEWCSEFSACGVRWSLDMQPMQTVARDGA